MGRGRRRRAVSFSRNDVLIKAFQDAGQEVPEFLRAAAEAPSD